ncbi:MAG: OmpA family protein [Treponema sp.]|nr:OmpA family protein [Treponema sp.]
MKKTLILLIIGLIFVSCKSTPPEDPKTLPEITVEMPELFSPDPDIENDEMSVPITIKHPVPIKEWSILVQPQRGGGQRPEGEARQRPEGEGRQRPEGEEGEQRQRRQRPPFYQENGTGNPPKVWKWNGRGTSGEMVQSAMDYRFNLTVSDSFGNKADYEGIISVDVLVKREGDIYKIVVPSIVFPPDSADFSLLSQEDMRGNRRILFLIARALNRFEGYAITVEGHANPTTAPDTPERNTEETGSRTVIGLKPLSEDRAKAVMNFLIENHEISKDRLTAIGMGGSRTVAEYDDEEENWKNRRVEFILQK